MHPVLAAFLGEWQTKTPHGKETDFVFPSLRAERKVPVSPAMFVADHLRTAAKATGIVTRTGAASDFII